MSEILQVERRGAVIAGFMNRPHVHNALNSELREALLQFWSNVRHDDSIRVAIISGVPGSSFGSGRDMKETHEAYSAGETGADWELSNRTGYPVDSPTGKPIIAAIDGYCFGAGLKVAAECDLRICTPEAVFASPQAKVGRATESPLYLKKAGVPSAVVMDMVFTGKRLSGAVALHYGLVSRVVERNHLIDEAWGMAKTICEMSPMVVTGLKKGIDAELAEMPTAIASPLWKSLTAMYGDTGDARQGAEEFARRQGKA
jgi:enoyl-CoA hydratase/carnithine racemase